MRITGIHTGEIQIPLARPFKTALRTVERLEDIVDNIHPTAEIVQIIKPVYNFKASE